MSTVISCLSMVVCLQIEALTVRGEGRQSTFLYEGEHIQADVSSKAADFILKNRERVPVGDILQIGMNKNKPKISLASECRDFSVLFTIGAEGGFVMT